MHRRPPPWALHNGFCPCAALLHPSIEHRLPPPCAMHRRSLPMAPLVHPGWMQFFADVLGREMGKPAKLPPTEGKLCPMPIIAASCCARAYASAGVMLGIMPIGMPAWPGGA